MPLSYAPTAEPKTRTSVVRCGSFSKILDQDVHVLVGRSAYTSCHYPNGIRKHNAAISIVLIKFAYQAVAEVLKSPKVAPAGKLPGADRKCTRGFAERSEVDPGRAD